MRSIVSRIIAALVFFPIGLFGQGTFLVKDLAPGFQSSTPKFFMKAGGLLYFSAYSETYKYSLYKTDGTDLGTSLVMEELYCYEPDKDNYKNYVDYNGLLAFTVYNQTTLENEVWVSNGSFSGTKKISDFSPGFKNGITQLTVFNNALYFVVTTSNNLYDGLYKWTGSGLATKLYGLGEAPTFTGHQLITGGGKLFFITNYEVLDFSIDTPVLLYNQLLVTGSDKIIGRTIFFNGKILMSIIPIYLLDANYYGISILDPVTLTTSMITTDKGMDGRPTIAEMNGSVYFTNNPTIDGLTTIITIYKIDNLFNLSTVKVFDRNNAIVSNVFKANNSKLIFTIETVNLENNELWVSDGTEVGTLPLVELSDEVEITHQENTVALLDTVLFFQARKITQKYPYTIQGTELWRSNFTKSGTGIAVDFFQGVGHGLGFSELIQVNDSSVALCAYRSNDTDGALYGRELWITDGTPFLELTSNITESSIVSLSLFPNPTIDVLKLPLLPLDGIVTISNVQGNIVLELPEMPASNEINICNFQPGVYFLKIVTASTTYIDKITKY